MERSQWILALCIATFLVVVGIAALLFMRRQRRPETAVILDAIDGARAQIDMDTRHNVVEHEAINKRLDKANGRLQFLIAKDIAEELAASKAADARDIAAELAAIKEVLAPKDGEPNADGMPPVYDRPT